MGCDGDKGGGGACCRPAVERAYREMCRAGQPEAYALDAAREVYRWHHPGVPEVDALGIVTLWLADGHRH